MPATESSSRCVPRTGSQRSRVVLCTLAFATTVGIVFWKGPGKTPSPKLHTATARIVHWLAPSSEGTVSATPKEPLPDPSEIVRQISSNENLDRALRGSTLDGSPDEGGATPSTMADIIGEVRRNLRVTTSESSSPSQVRISICYSGDDASRAVEVVNALAKHYAEGHLAAPERAVLEKCRQAEGAAKRAREEFLEAKGRLEEFVEQTFADQQAWAEREQTRPPDPPRPTGRAPSPPPPKPSPPKPSPPPPVDNPQRAELVKDLESLQRRRAQLLEDRTPLHPQVQDVEARIAQVNERLAAMPKQVPDQRLAGPPLPEAPALEPPPQESPPAVNGSPPFAEIAEQSAEALQDFRTLKQAVDQARERYDRLAERKRQAWQERLRLPRIELELAESCQAGPAASRPPRLGLLGLAAALAMAAGVGLISAGFDHDPTLTTPTQAEKAVPAAIVGVIPATDPRRTQAPDQRSESVGGLGKIIVGAVLVAICLGILVAIL